MYARLARPFRLPAMILLLSAAGLGASSCGQAGPSGAESEGPSQVEVTVSLYSGLDNPTIQVPEADYDEIVACVQNANPGSEVVGDYGIPAFVIDGDAETFFIQEDGVVREASAEVVSVDDCGEAFGKLFSVSSEQLTEEELEFLEGK